MFQAIWYIKIAGRREGPYSIAELKRDGRVTPTTQAWKPGMMSFRPIREIEELYRALFLEEDEEEVTLPPDEELTLDLQKEPPTTTLFFLFLLLLLTLYIFLQWII